MFKKPRKDSGKNKGKKTCSKILKEIKPKAQNKNERR